MGYRCDNKTNNPYEKARRVKAGIGTEWTIANDGHGQQNAVAERAIATTRTLADILINSDMHSISPKMARRLWPYAHRHAVHLQLLWPTAHNPGRASPGEMRYNGSYHHIDRFRSVRAQCRPVRRRRTSCTHILLSCPSSRLRRLLLSARSLSAPGPLRAASASRTPVALPPAARPRPSRSPGGKVPYVDVRLSIK